MTNEEIDEQLDTLDDSLQVAEEHADSHRTFREGLHSIAIMLGEIAKRMPEPFTAEHLPIGVRVCKCGAEFEFYPSNNKTECCPKCY